MTDQKLMVGSKWRNILFVWQHAEEQINLSETHDSAKNTGPSRL